MLPHIFHFLYKSKLEELVKEVKIEPQKLQTEVSKVIDIMRAQLQLRQAGRETAKPVSTDTVQDTSLSEANADIQQVSQAVSGNQSSSESGDLTDSKNLDTDAKADLGKDDDKTQSMMKSDSPKKSEETVTVTANVKASQVQESIPESDNQNVQPIIDLQTNQLNSQVPVSKTSNVITQPVKTADVLNQVIEQAKVTLGHDKSEMVIDLKPDHLGKLSLKVVTEQGIVAAKFMAENQQVKEVLESNMQLLKDSLQKQGISIDGVSVQVGNQNKNSFQQEAFESKKGSSLNRVGYQGGNKSSVSGITTIDVLPEKLAQYAYETSTLNLTA
jgi:flagellar hook-length control protein FliK